MRTFRIYFSAGRDKWHLDVTETCADKAEVVAITRLSALQRSRHWQVDARAVLCSGETPFVGPCRQFTKHPSGRCPTHQREGTS
jgi:hypothetical protein